MELAAELEDGELGDYSPLPRPDLSTVRAAPRIEDSSSDDDGDDSDGPKRPRLKCLPKPSAVPAKFNIWAENLQEEALTEKLVTCGVQTQDRSRDVESYFVPRGERSATTKRSHDGVSIKDRLGPRPQSPSSSSSDEGRERVDARYLLDLRVTDDSDPTDAATDIANKLYEEKDDLVSKVVKVLGIAKAIKLYNRTKEIEADGGMMILNGARRRTPGGVFFYLTRTASDASREQLSAMFDEDQRAGIEKKRMERAKKRQEKTAILRQLAQASSLPTLPKLPTRVEAMISEAEKAGRVTKAEDKDEIEEEGEIEDDEHTDEEAKDPVKSSIQPHAETASLLSSREVLSYDDDFLQVDADMDLF